MGNYYSRGKTATVKPVNDGLADDGAIDDGTIDDGCEKEKGGLNSTSKCRCGHPEHHLNSHLRDRREAILRYRWLHEEMVLLQQTFETMFRDHRNRDDNHRRFTTFIKSLSNRTMAAFIPITDENLEQCRSIVRQLILDLTIPESELVVDDTNVDLETYRDQTLKIRLYGNGLVALVRKFVSLFNYLSPEIQMIPNPETTIPPFRQTLYGFHVWNCDYPPYTSD